MSCSLVIKMAQHVNMFDLEYFSLNPLEHGYFLKCGFATFENTVVIWSLHKAPQTQDLMDLKQKHWGYIGKF